MDAARERSDGSDRDETGETGRDRDETDEAGRAREHRQEMLDEALEDTFPASDPPAVRPNRKDPDPVPEDADPVQDDGAG